MKKSILKFSGALLFGAIVLTSCNKTVTPRKLDGEWTVTSATGSYSQSENGNKYSSATATFNGTTMTYISDGDSGSEDMTITYSFDKKAGTYTKVTTSTSTGKSIINYYTQIQPYQNQPSVSYNFVGKLDRKSVSVSTDSEKGTFTITGGTGDIEKNTVIVLTPTSITKNGTVSYSYFIEGTSTQFTHLSDKYTNYNSSSYEVLPSSKTTNETDTFKSSSKAEILKVESLKKGVMIIDMNDEETNVEGADTRSYSSKMKYTLTQK